MLEHNNFEQSREDRDKISAFIICLNEEEHIGRCLESVKWCDEIIVIDSGSTDKTLSICRQFNARIFERAWPGYVEQKRFGLSQCQFKWVLNIDADEEVSQELSNQILEVLRKGRVSSDQPAGYYLLRIVHYLGRWWRKGGWFPEYRMRLMQREFAKWGGRDPHESALVSGPTAKLSGELRHYSFETIAEHVAKLNSHSSVAAQELHRNGHRSSLSNVLFNPVMRFLKFFCFKRGFLEGRAGLVAASLETYYVFLKYAKLWEIEKHSEH